MLCLLTEVFEARFGGPVSDARMVEAPSWMGRGAPHALGKGVYGTSRAHHVEGGNFTVQWDDASVDPDRAAAVLARLEAAWLTLIDTDGWTRPVSSDAWLLWVVLDPGLAGSGYTTEYTDDTYPDGYPVIWLNPSYEEDNPDFGLSVAVHEFGHALQYAVRTPSDYTDAWYWEATSEWVAEHAAEDLDTYAESTYWYAMYPHGSWSAPDRYHPYGMVVLNAWLDERVFGFEGIRDIWTGAEGVPWEERIPEVAGMPLEEILPEMAAEVAAGTLREGALYTQPSRFVPEADWATVATPGLYGSYYLDFEGELEVEGAVEVRYVTPGWVGTEAPSGDYTAVLTAIGAGDLSVGRRPVEAPPGCGCQSTSAPSLALYLLLLLPFRRSI